MSSRQEEKAQRRAEREASEAAAARSAARASRVRIGAAGLAGVALLVGVVLAIGAGTSGAGEPQGEAADTAPIPAQRVTDLDEAVAAAKCELTSPPSRGQQHVSEPVEYKENPPTSGDHSPEAALDGIYSPGTSPEPENWVHSLEHGRVVVQYRPKTAARTVSQLETVVSEELSFGRPGYLSTLLENTTGMRPAVVATAWTKLLTCDTMNPQVFDAIRAFRTTYTDRGPEVGIPPTN